MEPSSGTVGGTSGAAAAAAAAAAPWTKRAAAWVMSKMSAVADSKLRPWKERLLPGLGAQGGTVLELGIGDAPNLKYYGAGVDRIIGVDLNPAVMQYASRAAAEAGLPPGRLQLVLGSAERLPLEDGSLDAVVGTHVLCSVDSPQQAVAEVLRVLKPGGHYIFMEHVAAPPGSRVATLQRWVAPVVRLLANNCHVDRTSLATIHEAGFSAVQAEDLWLDIPAALTFWAPHVCGIAVK